MLKVGIIFCYLNFFSYICTHKNIKEPMAKILIDTDKLSASLDYYESGWFGISITYEGKVIKKLEK